MSDKSIRITADAHKALVLISDLNPIKMGKYASIAIIEKIDKESKKKKKV